MDTGAPRRVPAPAGETRVAGPNPEQLRAITHTSGPLLVTAGPGTGKTYVIEQKVVHLCTREKVPAARVLCLTFTEKAAGELRDRVGDALATARVPGEVHASTFHGWCQGLLTEFAGRAGLPPNYHLLNGAPLDYLLVLNLKRFEVGHFPLNDGGLAFAREALWLRQRCLQERVTPEQALIATQRALENAKETDERASWAEAVDLAASLPVIDDLLARAGAVTYDDLIARALTLVETDPVVRRSLAQRYAHLLVDEFQDDNYAQAQLVHALAGIGLTVTVVGDEDQSIYKFRGAWERTMKDFLARFDRPTARKGDAGGGGTPSPAPPPGNLSGGFRGQPPEPPVLARVDLVRNYRSTPTILDTAEVLIRRAQERLDKPPLKAARKDLAPDSPPTTVLVAEYPDDEARAVAAEARRLHDEEGVAWGDMAVLYRAVSVPTVRVLPQALDELGIPRELTSAGDLFARAEVKDLVSWVLVLRNPDDPGPALHRVLVSPEVALPLTDEPALTHAVKYGRPVRGLWAIESDDVRAHVSSDGRRALAHLAHLARYLTEQRRTLPPSAFVGSILRHTGLLARMTRSPSGAARTTGLADARALVQLVGLAREWERAHPLATADDFADYLSFLVRRGSEVEDELEPALEEDTVKVLTVHKSKGKEFPVVFVVGLNEDQFPPRKRAQRPAEPIVAAAKGLLPPGELDLEEERRMLFVACTRARDRLYLTRHRRTTATSRGVKKPSRFLAEIGVPREGEEGEPPRFVRVVEAAPTAEGDARPLAMDEGLWLVNRVAAEVRRLTQVGASPKDLADGARRVVEAALRAVSHAHPEAPVEDLARRLEGALGAMEPRSETRRATDLKVVRGVLPGFRFSYSAFNTYDTCPKQFYYRYVLGVPQPPSPALDRGSLVHRILQRFHDETAGNGSREDLVQLLDDELARRVTAEHEKEASDARADILAFIDAYWQGRGQFPGSTLHVEHKLQIDLDDFHLTAKLDRVDERADGVELVDYKTGKAESVKTYVEKDLQIPLYVLAWQKQHGAPPRYATVWSLKDGKVQRIDVARELGPEKLAAHYETARGIVQKVHAGAFEATPGYQACRQCPFAFVCDEAE